MVKQAIIHINIQPETASGGEYRLKSWLSFLYQELVVTEEDIK